MLPWCTCLFCIGWLGNVQRFITRAEPLYDSLNPLFCDFVAAVVVCARSLLLWSIKSHDVDLSVFCVLLFVCLYICDLNLKVIEKFQANSYRLPHCTICPWKYPEIRPGIFILFFMAPGIFGRMVSAHGKRCFSLDHRTTNRQGNLSLE